MPDNAGLEFTGERVVPGLVDVDLLNEHLARYRFAERFAEGRRVLDAGCGSGYGTAEFRESSSVVGVDLSADAVTHARSHFSRPGVGFLQASCEAFPFGEDSFDLVTAFEVIEHLEHWERLLTESRRVLTPGGLLLVSTPNKAYYAEARGAAGPNPYHVHEFEYGEFIAALESVFPHVQLWTQNHAEAIAFLPAITAAGDFDASGNDDPEEAHFFLAVCSRSPIPPARAFAWWPAAGNILRQRERHIALLESELVQKDAWLRQTLTDKASLQKDHERVLAELERHNEWAGKLNLELRGAGAEIARLQSELEATHAGYESHLRKVEEELTAAHAGYQQHVRQLESEAAVRLEWVHDLEAQIATGRDAIERLERENMERAQWGQSLDASLRQAHADNARLETQLHLTVRSKWFRLGRLLHLGPAITGKDGTPE